MNLRRLALHIMHNLYNTIMASPQNKPQISKLSLLKCKSILPSKNIARGQKLMVVALLAVVQVQNIILP